MERCKQMGINTRSSAKTRVRVYDWLRLIATIYVVIGHSAYLSIQETHGGVNYILPASVSSMYDSSFISFIRMLSGWVYGFHMPLFFMLSGSVFALRPVGRFDDVFRSKVKRLIIPYFVYGWLFMIPIKRLGGFYTNSTMKQALSGFLSGQDSGHLWFLPALFWSIIMFTVLLKVFDRLKINSIYAPLIVALIIHLLFDRCPIDFLGMKSGLCYLVYFAIGYVFEYERRRIKKPKIITVLILLCMVTMLEVVNGHYNILDEVCVLLVGSFMTYLLAEICDRTIKISDDSRVWKFVIRNLFYVYLLHDPLEYIVLRIFMNGDLMSTSWGCILYTALRTIIIFIVTLFMGEFIDNIKKRAAVLLGSTEKEIAK